MGERVRLEGVEVKEGELVGVGPERGWLLCLARVNGKLRAIDDWCNHAGCRISEGWIDSEGGADMAVCPCHAIGFDLATGRNLTAPQIAGDQRAFRVVEEGGALLVELPEVRGPFEDEA